MSPVERPAAGPRRWWRRLAIAVGGLTVALALLETACWIRTRARVPDRRRQLFDLSSRPPREWHCYSSNPHGEFTPAPRPRADGWQLIDFRKREYPLVRLSETPWAVEYRRDRRGLRQGNRPEGDEVGKPRVLLAGASFVYGEGVPWEQTLGRHLARRADHAGWINGGLPGADTPAVVRRTATLLPELAADRVLLVWTPHDLSLPPELAREEMAIHDLVHLRQELLDEAPLGPGPLSRSHLWRTVVEGWLVTRITQRTVAWYARAADPRANAAGLARLRSDFAELAALAPGRAAVVLFPLLIDLERNYPLAASHAAAADAAQAAGLPVCDLTATFYGSDTASLWVHPVDHHPNGHALDRAAAAITAWLAAEVPEFLVADPATAAGETGPPEEPAALSGPGSRE